VKQKKINSKTIETLTHDEAKRKNIPTAEFQSVLQKEAQDPLKIKYMRSVNGLDEEKANRNHDLDPQLVWRGKDEQDWSDLVVYTNQGDVTTYVINYLESLLSQC
jgi:adenine-specific DNA-methyltransferase